MKHITMDDITEMMVAKIAGNLLVDPQLLSATSTDSADSEANWKAIVVAVLRSMQTDPELYALIQHSNWDEENFPS